MRTIVDLPDALLRQLKARAAFEGMTLDALMQSVLERGLTAGAEDVPESLSRSTVLPSIRLGRPLNLAHPSNAALFELFSADS